MKTILPKLTTRLFGRAGESVTRSDRRKRELEFESPFPPLTARPNRRRDESLGLFVGSSPLGGAPEERQSPHQNLTPVGRPDMSHSERRFAPTTVRQSRNGVRYGLEQVSAFIGIRTMLNCAGGGKGLSSLGRNSARPIRNALKCASREYKWSLATSMIKVVSRSNFKSCRSNGECFLARAIVFSFHFGSLVDRYSIFLFI
jgi:hypothetical protein